MPVFIFILLGIFGNVLQSETLKENQREISFQAISWGVLQSELWFKNVNGEKVNIYPLPHMRSKEESASIINSLNFYSEKIDNEGNPVPVGSVIFPEGASKFLLLFSKKTNSDYFIIALPDDYESFPFGSIKIYNATPFKIAYKFNDDQLRIESMKSIVHTIKGSDKVSSTSVMIAFKVDDMEWKRGYSNRWSFKQDTRTLIVVTEKVDTIGNKGVVVKRIKERQMKPPVNEQ
jgi:hypothetical protein